MRHSDIETAAVVRTVAGFSDIQRVQQCGDANSAYADTIVGIAAGVGNRHRRGTSALATGLRLAREVVVSHRCCRVVPRRA